MRIRMRNPAYHTVFFFFFKSHDFFLFKSLGGNPEVINPLCPADLVIDHRFLKHGTLNQYETLYNWSSRVPVLLFQCYRCIFFQAAAVAPPMLFFGTVFLFSPSKSR
jgi:hypothetical protein